MITNAPTTPATRWSLLAVLILGPLLWIGCDTIDTTTNNARSLVLTYEGDAPIKHMTSGDGLIERDGNGSVLFKSPSGEGEIRLDVSGATQGDFHFKPAGIEEGETFQTVVNGRSNEPLAQVNHRRTEDGTYQMEAGLGNIDIREAMLELRNNGNVLYRTPFSGMAGAVGKSDKEPTSWHFSTTTIEGEGTVTTISVDYESTEDDDGSSDQPSSKSTASAGAGEALVWPAGTDDGPFPSTHVSLVLKGTSLQPGDVSGVSFSGARAMTITNAALSHER